MTPQEVYDNWSAYLRGVDRADFLEQLKAIAPPSAIGRTDADYAIEFGGYLAKAAEDFLAARDRFIELDEGDEVLAEGALADAEEAVSDHHAGLREAIYEFRKRAERAKAAPSTVASTNAAPQGAGLTVSNPASTDETSSPAGAAPTPRTDAHLAHLNLPDGRKVGIPNEALDLLRQLERELAEERDHHTQTVRSQDDRMLADAVRSRIPGVNTHEAFVEAVRATYDFSYVVQRAQEMVGIIENEQRRPSVLFRPQIYIDGDKWCALYGANVQDGVMGSGNSPDEAMADFDKAWWAKLPSVGGRSDAPQS